MPTVGPTARRGLVPAKRCFWMHSLSSRSSQYRQYEQALVRPAVSCCASPFPNLCGLEEPESPPAIVVAVSVKNQKGNTDHPHLVLHALVEGKGATVPCPRKGRGVTTVMRTLLTSGLPVFSASLVRSRRRLANVNCAARRNSKNDLTTPAKILVTSRR